MFDSLEQFSVALLALIVFVIFATVCLRLRLMSRRLGADDARMLDIFRERVNKIPTLIESVRRHTETPNVFDSILPVYRKAILLQPEDIYAILELDRKISAELAFLLRFSLHVGGLGRDGHFIAIRNFLVYYERSMVEKLRDYNKLVRSYNRLIKLKNWTIIGLLVPVRELVEVV